MPLYLPSPTSSANVWTATQTFRDANFEISDNSDTTKKLAFEVSGVATGTTRTLTVPNASGTIALTSDLTGFASVSGTNSWTGTQSFRDTSFLITDDADSTKKIAFEASGITTGTTRTLTAPNASGTIALTSDLTGFASVSGTNSWTGTQSFRDTSFLITDDADSTKKIAFEASGITTGTTRTLTSPNASGTIAILSLAQTWTAAQTFQTNPGVDPGSGSAAATITLTGRAVGSARPSTVTGNSDGSVQLDSYNTAGVKLSVSGTTRLTVLNGEVATNSVPFVTVTSAGAPSMSSSDGGLAVDTTNHTLYFRSGTTWRAVGGSGASVSSPNTWTGTQTFRDANFEVTDDADTTKKLTLQLSGITTGTTRTLTIPNASGTIALTSDLPTMSNYGALASANVWTATQTFRKTDGTAAILVDPNTTNQPGRIDIYGRGAAGFNATSFRVETDGTTRFDNSATSTPYVFRFNGSTDRLSISNTEVATNGIPLVTLTSAGAPSASTSNGSLAVDTTNHVFYFRSGGTWRTAGGASTSANNTWSGIQTFNDAAFELVDDADATKKITFQLSGVATGTTRTLTVPNASGTIALLADAQTFGSGLGVDPLTGTSNALFSVVARNAGSVAGTLAVTANSSGSAEINSSGGNLILKRAGSTVLTLAGTEVAVGASTIALVTNTSAGAPSGTQSSGALTVDTTNNALYFRSTGSWFQAAKASDVSTNTANIANDDWKQSVKAVATTNVTVSGPGASIDGVSLTSGDRVLLAGQTTASENGIYIWNGAAAAMTRSTDADTTAKVSDGLIVSVDQGTANADSMWQLTTNDPITVDTTSLTFSKVFPVTKIWRDGKTWPVAGNITTSLNIPEFYVPKTSTQTTKIVGYRAKVGTGTSATVEVRLNGTAQQINATSTSQAVTTTATTYTPTTPITLADGDTLDLVCTAISGTPADLSFTVILEHTV